jgi:hypothetical protein
MLERKPGDSYILTVDEMAGVYDMLEESHFPISVTFTFLAEWFESVSCFDTAEKIRNLLDTYLEDENKLLKHMILKHMNCKCANEEAEDEPYTDMRPFDPSRIAKSKISIDEWLSNIPGGPISEEFILKEQEEARERFKEEGENDES